MPHLLFFYAVLYFDGDLKMKKRESDFQSNLIKELKARFPGCEIFKTDPEFKRGVPDLIILFNNKWALLECKRERDASKRNNQEYWVNHFNQMSFSRFIFPENKEEVLNELSTLFSI